MIRWDWELPVQTLCMWCWGHLPACDMRLSNPVCCMDPLRCLGGFGEHEKYVCSSTATESISLSCDVWTVLGTCSHPMLWSWTYVVGTQCSWLSWSKLLVRIYKLIGDWGRFLHTYGWVVKVVYFAAWTPSEWQSGLWTKVSDTYLLHACAWCI